MQLIILQSNTIIIITTNITAIISLQYAEQQSK